MVCMIIIRGYAVHRYSNVIPSEPDPREHCQLPVAQVSHQARDEPEAPGVTVVETPASKDELGAPQMTPAETPWSRSELEVQNTQVDVPSLYFVFIGLNSSDYLHSAPSDKQWSFYIISQCTLRPLMILDFGFTSCFSQWIRLSQRQLLITQIQMFLPIAQ
jgi:hypothetical protein